MHADAAFRACLELPGARTVLDVGSGAGEHAAAFRARGLNVTTVDLAPGADVTGDYLDMRFGLAGFDIVWASHVLEHQRNPGRFLERLSADCSLGGWLAITVPPMKDEVVGGHVALFNAGVLLYQLILAGINCRHAAVRTYGYNVSVIVRNERAVLPPLKQDAGDIERLAEFFPLPVYQGFDGRIERLNWPWP